MCRAVASVVGIPKPVNSTWRRLSMRPAALANRKGGPFEEPAFSPGTVVLGRGGLTDSAARC